MQDLIRQLTSILGGMWKYRWLGLATAWVVGVVGVGMGMRVPDKFEAAARIHVDTQSILKPLMAGLAIQPNVDQQVAMLSRTLISRPNIEKLIRMADLDLKSTTKPQQDALIDSLARTLQIRSAGRDNLYTMSYWNEDKDKAKRVVQSLVSIFVESSLGSSRKDTDSAKVFLNEQIKSHEAKLEEAETRLKEFKIRNIDLQTADGRDSAGQLQQISQQLKQARLELSEAENAREAVRKQIQVEKSQGASQAAQSLPIEPVIAPVSTPELDARIGAQKRNLDGLLQRFTDLHPDVIAARKLIKELEEQRLKEVAELRKAAKLAAVPIANDGGSMQSLMAQELNRLAAAAEAQVAGLKARVAEYASRMANARDAMKTAPQLEAEAAQLNRDYGIIKRNYENLVSRRQAAQMSGELEVASGVADFRLIDPPRVDPKPVSPNRLMLLAMASAAALAAGLFVPFALAQLRPVFDAAQELRVKTSLPVLGVVSLLVNDVDVRRGRMSRWRFLAGSGGLIGFFAIALVWLSIMAARQVG